MGGDIVIAQRRSGGTTFTLTVTLTRAKAPKTASSAIGEGASSGPASALRVLSVEDNPFGRVVLNAILTELGHQAEFIGAAKPPRNGSARSVRRGADDMVLPGISGIELSDEFGA